MSAIIKAKRKRIQTKEEFNRSKYFTKASLRGSRVATTKQSESSVYYNFSKEKIASLHSHS
jgi:hypothetical protein